MFQAPARQSTDISRTGNRPSLSSPRQSLAGGRPSLNISRRKSSNQEVSPIERSSSAPPVPSFAATQDGTREPSAIAESNDSTPSMGVVDTGPPPLEYSLRIRKWSILLFWSLVFLDSVAMPIALYFGLFYGTHLSHNAVFSISTGALGCVSIVEYFLRFWRLWKKGSTCRAIGARRAYLDWFHWNYSFAWMIIMIELIVGTVPTEPPIRLLSMPVPTLTFAFGVELLIVDVARLLGMRAPFRISSLPQGAPLRPGIYSIIEDIVAVDGSGGTEFRERFNARYNASHYFRQMLHRLTLFWAIPACLVAGATTAIIFTVSKDVAYVLGWTLPFASVYVMSIGIGQKIVQKSEQLLHNDLNNSTQTFGQDSADLWHEYDFSFAPQGSIDSAVEDFPGLSTSQSSFFHFEPTDFPYPVNADFGCSNSLFPLFNVEFTNSMPFTYGTSDHVSDAITPASEPASSHSFEPKDLETSLTFLLPTDTSPLLSQPTTPLTTSAISSSSDPTANPSKKRALSPGTEAQADRRRRNNAAAAKYRQKKVDRIAELEQALEEAAKEKDSLKLQLAEKNGEVEVLRRLLSQKA
ncbi:MAG: hypothetical protein M1821_001067 [Bathelium mastoideum]|nr:MAG: hypothetical protein M1821_001067 [Bathelium mastoideum]